ncbi:hypothetical protein HMPREF9120_02413 [Neisseria sp. oral taxon 020 str. F0370]|nr:hypothetical protein HMPREF9120_02413 [Neisseria sp. oral taxon 020 str. F0370]
MYFCGTSAFLGYRHKAAVRQLTDFVSPTFRKGRLKAKIPQASHPAATAEAV